MSPLRSTLAQFPTALCLSGTQSSLVFTAKCYVNSSLSTDALEWGAWYEAGTPLSSDEISIAEVTLTIINSHMCHGVRLARFVFPPFYQS